LPERTLGPVGAPPGIPSYNNAGQSNNAGQANSSQAVLAGYTGAQPGAGAGQHIAPAGYQAPSTGHASPLPFGTQGTPATYEQSNPGAARITGVQPLGR
jgi:hypothetical protein